jgi:hypothetical protein
VISDFDEIFSVCRAFNSDHFDKKKFSKSFCFHGARPKILLSLKCQKRVFTEFWPIVFDSFLHQNKDENKIQGHIRNPREKAHRIILNLTWDSKKIATHMWLDCLPTGRKTELLIISKSRIARYSGSAYSIEHHLLYNPEISEFSTLLIRLKYWANFIK